MRLNKNPIFRKVIVPWYDSEVACLFVIVCMFFVFLFGLSGLSVIGEKAEYKSYIWVPVVLMILSGGVIFSIAIRLIKRYAYRFYK